MTILTTITALQTLHATVAGVTTAPTVYPGKLNSADLPMILVLPADGTADLEAIGARKRHDGIYRAYVYVAPLTEGVPVDEGVQTCILLLQALLDMYLNSTNVQLTTSPSQAIIRASTTTPIRHSPIATLPFGGTDYRGFTVDISVMEKW